MGNRFQTYSAQCSPPLLPVSSDWILIRLQKISQASYNPNLRRFPNEISHDFSGGLNPRKCPVRVKDIPRNSTGSQLDPYEISYADLGKVGLYAVTKTAFLHPCHLDRGSARYRRLESRWSTFKGEVSRHAEAIAGEIWTSAFTPERHCCAARFNLYTYEARVVSRRKTGKRGRSGERWGKNETNFFVANYTLFNAGTRNNKRR